MYLFDFDKVMNFYSSNFVGLGHFKWITLYYEERKAKPVSLSPRPD